MGWNEEDQYFMMGAVPVISCRERSFEFLASISGSIIASIITALSKSPFTIPKGRRRPYHPCELEHAVPFDSVCAVIPF